MSNTKGMQPAAAQSLHNAITEMQQRGIPVHLNSGYRSPQQQKALYQKALAGDNPYPVAPPGQSRHQLGIAADLGIPTEHRDAANAILAKHGWTWAGPPDAVHYDFTEALVKSAKPGKGDAAGDTGGQGDGWGQDLDGEGYGIENIDLGDKAPDINYVMTDTHMGAGDPPPAWTPAGAAAAAAQMAAIANQPLSIPSPANPAILGGMQSLLGQTQDLANNGVGGMMPAPTVAPTAFQAPQDAAPAAPVSSPWYMQPVNFVKDYFNNTVNPFSGVSIGNRLNYAVKPMTDLANFLTFHQIQNVMQHSLSPLMAGATQFLQQEGSGIRNNADIGAGFSPASRSAIWRSMVRAWSGQPDPTIQGGFATAAAGQDNPITQILDFAIDWELGGRFAHTFFSPILRGSAGPLGEAVRAMADQAASDPNAGLFARAAAAAEPLVSRGIGGQIRPGFDKLTNAIYQNLGDKSLVKWAMPTLQMMSNSGEDFRNGARAVIDNTRIIRTEGENLARISRQLDNLTRDTAKSGAPVTGNALEGTDLWANHPELQGIPSFTGNKLGQLVTHYVEAGSKGAMFDSPYAVMQQAAMHFPNNPEVPAAIAKIGEEAKALGLRTGQHMVNAGLMKPDVLAENAGNYIGRNYNLNQMSATDATAMRDNLLAQGHQNTPLFALVQNIAENGGQEGGPMMGGPKPGSALRDINQQRELLDPDERLAHLPNFDFTRSAKAGLKMQLGEVAKANLMKDIANPQMAMSLASQMPADFNRGDITKQPALVGEALRNAKELASIKEQFEKKGGINDTRQMLEDKANKAYQDHKDAMREMLAHQAAEPQIPEAPTGGPVPSGGVKAFKPNFLDTAEQKVAKRFSQNLLGKGVAAAKERVSEMVDQAHLNQYARDLASWSKQHGVWEKKLGDLTDRADKLSKAAQDAQTRHDVYFAKHAKLAQDADILDRRNELLTGQRSATYNDAADALAKAAKKVDPTGRLAATMPAATRQALLDNWLHHWTNWNHDIYSDIGPKGLPYIPKGLDPEVVKAMGENNPLIAMQLGPGLSEGDGEISAADAAKKGWIRWQSQNNDYGAMEGRWASAALKKFVDDAMDTRRFSGKGAEDIAGATKFLGEFMRSMKLYLNPVSHMNVHVQSVFDNIATAKEAGKTYSPTSDLAGRKEWGEWLRGGPETPTVKAILDFGNEMAGGPRHSIDPYIANAHDPLGGLKELGTAGQKAYDVLEKARSAKNWMRDRFVDAQVMPKAGLVKVLMDQGVDPMAAAKWAEIAHGGAGAEMGGLETPGIMHLAEMLNRNGVAMFTSYPLHSITRMLQLMENSPQSVMAYPLLRNYLVQQSSPEMQQEVKDRVLGYSEIPLPTNNPLGRFFANPNGTEGVINASNAIPYGGAFGSTSFPNLLSMFNQGNKAVEATDRSGLNPYDTGAESAWDRAKGVLPGTIPDIIKVFNAATGRLPGEGATEPQTVQQALTALFGLPMRHPETGLSREFNPAETKAIGNRMNFVRELDDRYYKGLDSGEPDMTKIVSLTRMDPATKQMALDKAVDEMTRLTTDRNLNERQAQRMIRNQSGYIHSLMYLIGKDGPRAENYQQSMGIH